jgi:butyrate kinase
MSKKSEDNENQISQNEAGGNSGYLNEMTGDNFAVDNSEAESETDIRDSISEEDIRKRAYEIFLERGGLPGPPEADWYKAEEELIRKAYQSRGK